MTPQLSARQLEVLRLLADGMDNREVAFVLGVSVSTVRGLVTTVLEKCGLNNRQQAAAYLARLPEATP